MITTLRDLPEGEKTVNVGVVEPEGWVETGLVEVRHVAITTDQNVDKTMDRLERRGAVWVAVGCGVVGHLVVGLAVEEHLVDLSLEATELRVDLVGHFAEVVLSIWR